MIFYGLSRITNGVVNYHRFLSRATSSYLVDCISSPLLQRNPPLNRPACTNNIQHCACFVAPRRFSTATRRRRRVVRNAAVPETPNASTDQTVDALAKEHFQSAANQLFDQVESSINKLKECNQGLEIERFAPYIDNKTYSDDDEGQRDNSHSGQILIHIPPSNDAFWGGGTYKLTIHSEPIEGVGRLYNGYVALQSPLSGSFSYVYNVRTGEWEGTEDGHKLVGMFTRDFIRQCQGVPDF